MTSPDQLVSREYLSCRIEELQMQNDRMREILTKTMEYMRRRSPRDEDISAMIYRALEEMTPTDTYNNWR